MTPFVKKCSTPKCNAVSRAHGKCWKCLYRMKKKK